MFRIGLPNPAGRLQILKLTLGNHPVEDEVTDFLPELSKITRGYSGSDLKELCKCAALESVREMIRDTARKAVREGPTATVDDDTAKEQTKKPKLRPMKIADIKVALTKVKKTGQAAAEYDASRQSTNPSAGADDAKTQAMLKSMIPLLRMLSTSTQLDNGEDDEKSDGDGNAIPEIE
uniref:AAA ATPase AAA+ lid domain-containing protein n=2 Tax=Craspedostauros australis TaxID=1486917 RepID=A0A7S0F713_9STRA|mmetsp:Transcript_8634/g.23325  ORF Transcript_8634/g.23325 Transcript_8634/m.23325 type:complete len:178 (+) Transcript_8634:196-729(+)